MAKNKLLVFLSFLLALVGGTGAYALSSVSMNLIYLASVIAFLWIQLQQYEHNGAEPIEFNFNKCLVFVLYVCFLSAYILRETLFDTEYQFQADGGIMREYADLFRGLVVFLIVGATYRNVKNSKNFVILPPLCLIVLLIGLFLETYQIIDFNSDVHEVEELGITPDDKLLARPGGFNNANMTAALSMIWLFISLESKINSSIILKVIAVITTLTICLMAQSRAAIMFLMMYTIYSLIMLRKVNFLISIVFVGLFLTFASYYFEFDVVNELLDRFSSRVDRNNGSTQERLSLISYAINSFQDSPLFGNGIYSVEKTGRYGQATHNQILDILSNFGLVGFFMMSGLYLTFYHKNSFSYLSLCILPTLLFSHNFFMTGAYPVAIAFAYHTINDKK